MSIQMKKYFILLLCLFSPLSFGAIIFQDNFDSNCSGAACNSGGGTSSYPTGWDQWMADDGQPVTVGGATHYGGEISSTGRGGSGRSLKLWRYNGYYGNYTGSLLKIFSGSYSNIWFRYYLKVPSAFQYSGSSGYKQWRFNISGGGGEIYLNVLCPSANCASEQTWGIYDNSSWTTVLSHAEYSAIRDGNWHAIQWNINLSTRAVTLYIDGVSKYSGTIANIGGTFQMMQHFPIGNSNDGHTWVSQSSWQAKEIDDVVFATTKAETDPVGGGGDTTPPTVSITAPSNGATVSGTITYSATASDNVAVAGVQFRVDGSNVGSEDTAAPYSISWNTTSVANGSRSLTAVARDTSSNTTVSSAVSVTVNNVVSSPTVALTASPVSIVYGNSSTLTWSSTNATSCTASNGWTGTKATSGSESVSPTSTNTYVLTCSGTGGSGSSSTTVSVTGGARTVFFTEGYEDTSFASRGWYDTTSGTLSTDYHSGARSLQCTYALGGNTCTAPSRHLFTASNGVYISYWVKYSSNFVGSGVGYHPHEFYLLTNLNGDYDGLAFDYLTMYLESHWDSSSVGYMQTGFQDGENIDQARLGQNLIGVTENRSVAGCNGSPSGYAGGCYDRGDGIYVNGVLLNTSQSFTTGNKNNWNHVEAYFQLNSITNGIGQSDGIIRIWFNNSLIFERTNVILRTGYRPTMKFNQLIFSSWIGDGSPVTQTMWIDDLIVASARSEIIILAAPTNIRIISQ